MIFPCVSQRVPNSVRPWRRMRQGSKNFLTLEGTNVFEAVQSFLPLFATFRESQSIQENQLLNVTVRALCHHSCHVTVFCWRAPWVWNQSRHRVNELRKKKKKVFQNLGDWLTPLSCSEHCTPQKLVEERMFLYTTHSGPQYHLMPLPSLPNSSCSPPKKQS